MAHLRIPQGSDALNALSSVCPSLRTPLRFGNSGVLTKFLHDVSRAQYPYSVPTKKIKQPLSVTHPELAKEAVGWDPAIVYAGSHLKKLWECNRGHQWIATIKNRALVGAGCPACSGKKVQVGFNDLKARNPSLAAEAHGWDPESVTAHSTRKEEWICHKGHIWKAVISNRSSGAGCPFCSGRYPIVGENDLATTNPELVDEIDGWDPTLVTRGSNKKLGWMCARGHKWNAVVYERATEGTGCPVCKNQRTDVGVNDLTITHPQVASEAAGWEPNSTNAGSHLVRKWKCSLNHEWNAKIVNRTRFGQGCPYCTNRKVLPGFNDLQTKFPEHAELADGWDPTHIVAGSHSRKPWRCKLGHKWTSSVENKTKKSLCPFCSNHKLWSGFNDLGTLFPELAKQLLEADPATIHPGTKNKVSWECHEGHRWSATVASRTSSIQAGCPTCAEFGFDPNQKGWLYFIEHSEWEMLQIGITNFPEDRLKSHKQLGWTLTEMRGPMDGLIAREWETAILRMLKAKGADLKNNKIAGKFDGYSEAWSKSTFRVSSIKELMRLTEDFEERK